MGFKRKSDFGYFFTNAEVVEKNSNFEGSIQLSYIFTPKHFYYINSKYTDRYNNQLHYEFSKNINASLFDLTKMDINKFLIEKVSSSETHKDMIYESEKPFLISFKNISANNYNNDKSRVLELYNKKDSILQTFGVGYPPKDVRKYVYSDDKYISVKPRDKENNVLSYEMYGYDANVVSNDIAFNYQRTYNNTWIKLKYELEKNVIKLNSIDGIEIDNPNDYIWTKFEIVLNPTNPSYINYNSNNYPYMGIKTDTIKFIDYLPEDCVAFDINFNRLTIKDGKIETNLYNEQKAKYGIYTEIYVGYPKDKYKGTTNTNKAELNAKYYSDEDFVINDGITFDIDDYAFSYSSLSYDINKLSNSIKTYYESLTGESEKISDKNYNDYGISPTLIYDGNGNVNLQLGDDKLYVSSNSNEYRRIEDDEYHFSFISINHKNIYNGNNKVAELEYDLYVRNCNEKEYKFYNSYDNLSSPTTTKNIYFNNDEKICGWYVNIKDINHNLVSNISSTYSSSAITTRVIFDKLKDIPEKGEVYNFTYIKATRDGKEIIQSTTNDYSEIPNGIDIEQSDLDEYNELLKRDYASFEYDKFEIKKIYNTIHSTKRMSKFTQDVEREKFTGTSTITINKPDIYKYKYITLSNYLKDEPREHKVEGYEIYDLLPKGMNMDSNADEIIDSLKVDRNNDFIFIPSDDKEVNKITDYFKKHTKVSIYVNWNNTGRTLLKVLVDLSDNPFIIVKESNMTASLIEISYTHSVSYDNYIEYGKTYENRVYTKFYKRELVNSKDAKEEDYFRTNYNILLDSMSSTNKYDVNFHLKLRFI